MKITDVTIFPYKAKKSNLKAFATVTFDDCFAVKSIRVMDGKKGLFISMPAQADNEGTYYDIAFPVTKEFRKELQEEIIDAYENYDEDEKPRKKSKKKTSKKRKSEEDEDEDEEEDIPF